MEDYAKFVLDRARVAARAPTQVAAEPAAAMVLPLKRKLEAAEAVLARETRAAAELDKALADPTIFTRDPAKAADLGRQRAKKQAALDAAETKWIAAAEAYEMAKANA
jgi:ATP-binding cassette subfamily F protein 3